MFQSSPSPKTGRYLIQVPIACHSGSCSNPHPVRKLGAMHGKGDRGARWCSNPHPVRKLGAIWAFNQKAYLAYPVPILTQSENWALLPTAAPIDPKVEVPILTQSENWALSLAKTYSIPLLCSNPHPVRKLGAISMAVFMSKV